MEIIDNFKVAFCCQYAWLPLLTERKALLTLEQQVQQQFFHQPSLISTFTNLQKTVVFWGTIIK